jgi:hypothetical protein
MNASPGAARPTRRPHVPKAAGAERHVATYTAVTGTSRADQRLTWWVGRPARAGSRQGYWSRERRPARAADGVGAAVAYGAWLAKQDVRPLSPTT